MIHKNITDSVIRREERHDDNNQYLYELLMRKGSNVADYKLPLYSIRVYMKDADGNGSTADARDAFSDSKKAISFFEKIVKNLATPLDLAYIVEDELLF